MKFEKIFKIGLLFCLAGFLIGTSKAGTLFSHSGATNPSTEGFTSTSGQGSSNVGPIYNDQGNNAWSISTLSQPSIFYYTTGPLSSQQQTDITNQGAVLSMDVRVLQGLAPTWNQIWIAESALGTNTQRFDILVGLDTNGDTIVTLPTTIDENGPGGASEAFGLSYTLTGSGSSYNKLQLVIQPGLQSANLYVNGVLAIQNYTGDATYRTTNVGYAFGDNSGGTTNFAQLSLSTGTSVVPLQSVSVPLPSAALWVLGSVLACFIGFYGRKTIKQ